MNGDNNAMPENRGPIAYMVSNGVAANLLMFFILAAGLVSLNGLVQEAFPVISFKIIEVLVSYPGATPEEVEESIVTKVEEQVSSLDGVREVTSTAAEGIASVMIKLRTGADTDKALNDIKAAVDRIPTFPEEAERAQISEMSNRQSVMRLALYGDIPERTLKELAYRTEDDLASLEGVSWVKTSGTRVDEVSIEASRQRLRAYGLTLGEVAATVRSGSLELSAGSVETGVDRVRVRTLGRRYDQQDFEDLIVLSRADGTVVRLGDIAVVRDGFQDADMITRFNGQPAAFVEVYRSADEQVLDMARAVAEHVENVITPSLPAGVGIAIWNNDATVYQERLSLLLKNGSLGLLLVLLALALFLEIRLALWVAVGIGVSGIGALAALFLTGVSLNIISLFSFVLAIGVVVDDAIVVAEQIHHERKSGASGVAAAVRGTRRVRTPLIFAVLTSMAAFSPLLFLPGGIGKVMIAVPITMIAMLFFSLIESLFVLPNHLSHLPGPEWKPTSLVDRSFGWVQSRVAAGLVWFTEGPLDRTIRAVVRQPGLTIAAALGVLILSVSLVPAGIVGVVFTEAAVGNVVVASLEMPEGTPARRTHEVASDLEAAGRRVIDRMSEGRPENAEPLLQGVNLTVGLPLREEGGGVAQKSTLNPQGHLGIVEMKLLGEQEQALSAETFMNRWREEVGIVPEARGLTFSAELIDFGNPVEVSLSHADPENLGPMGGMVVDRLRELQGVFDVRSDHSGGLREVKLALRPEARTLGLTLDDLAQQVRSAVFGAEALRMQRGREEVRVYVRLPEDERDTIADIERYFVRTPVGGQIPLSQVAEVTMGMSPPAIKRRDSRRVVTITADVDPAVITGDEATAVIETEVLPELERAYPGVSWTLGGQQQQQLESFDALNRSFMIAMLVIYALLAIPLGSYIKPLIIMAAIPFGIIGAILGHLILGLALSFTSVMGILGLSGVVVNDSLVMIHHINARLESGESVRTAIIEGAKGRFRPIFLTSATTFLGFTPLILERAVQAKFLVPFAASLGFGVAFATFVLMLVVPALMAIQLRANAN